MTQTWTRAPFLHSFKYNHKNSRWKTNTHVKSTFHLIYIWTCVSVCVCLELVIVCSFIFDNFFFVLFFFSFYIFCRSFVGGLIRLHQLSYCRNCFSVLWLINTHWPYVQIEYNKMYNVHSVYSNRKSTHTHTHSVICRLYRCVYKFCTNTLDSIYLHWQMYSMLLSLSSHIVFCSVLRLIPHWKLMGALSHIHNQAHIHIHAWCV